MLVAQLVEQSLLTQEICGSYPAIGKFYLPSIELKLYWKDEK